VCDGWAELKTSEIIVKLKDWLSTVAVASPRRPIIYTRSNYWRDMLGEALSLLKTLNAKEMLEFLRHSEF